MLDVAQVLI